VVDGYGDGYGDGDGDGDGYGYGYGDGDGDGDGYGYGYGYGYGSGNGSGNGYGDGDGDGYLRMVIEAAGGPRAARLLNEGATVSFWRSNKAGEPANGGSGPKGYPGLIEEIAGPLEICTKRALHATTKPWKWKGERLWIVALYPPIQTDDDKIGSLKREIICEIPNFF
jgi:hypothetical protein